VFKLPNANTAKVISASATASTSEVQSLVTNAIVSAYDSGIAVVALDVSRIGIDVILNIKNLFNDMNRGPSIGFFEYRPPGHEEKGDMELLENVMKLAIASPASRMLSGSEPSAFQAIEICLEFAIKTGHHSAVAWHPSFTAESLRVQINGISQPVSERNSRNAIGTAMIDALYRGPLALLHMMGYRIALIEPCLISISWY
jgi:hypothetical protein